MSSRLKQKFIKKSNDVMTGNLSVPEFYDYCVKQKILLPINGGFSSSTLRAIYEGCLGNKEQCIFCIRQSIQSAQLNGIDPKERIQWIKDNIRRLTNDNTEWIPDIENAKPVTFFVVNGDVFAMNHNPKKNQKLILPIRECNQFKEMSSIMLSAERDLKGDLDGAWVFTPLTNWKHRPFTIAESLEIELGISRFM
jgi:hypothetical protein